MTTAIIGVGNIGGAVARHLVDGGEEVVLAAREEPDAAALAGELGPLASAAPVPEAIKTADVVVVALWFDPLKQVISEYAGLLDGKVVADTSNPLGFTADGKMVRTLPEGQSQGSLVAAMLPASAHYVKAFGTLSAPSLAASANRAPRRAVLFYATDDDRAAAAIERLITAAGFDPVKAGGVNEIVRIEMPGGDLHEAGLGKLLDADEARAAVSAA
jgi:predicted dinucleotide-binding enzyme